MRMTTKRGILLGCMAGLLLHGQVQAQTNSFTVVPGQSPSSSTEPIITSPDSSSAGTYIYKDSQVPAPAYSRAKRGKGSQVEVNIPAEMHIQSNGKHYIIPERRLYADPIELMDTFDYFAPREQAFVDRGGIPADPASRRTLPALKRTGVSPSVAAKRAEAEITRARGPVQRPVEVVYTRPTPTPQQTPSVPPVQQNTAPAQPQATAPQTGTQTQPAFAPGAPPPVKQPTAAIQGTTQSSAQATPQTAPPARGITVGNPAGTPASPAAIPVAPPTTASAQSPQPIMPNVTPQPNNSGRGIQ